MNELAALQGTAWVGSAELWLDPLGDQALRSDCTLSVDGQRLEYTWSYEGKPQRGSITLRNGGADFTDTWHQPSAMDCRPVSDAWGLFEVLGEYGPASDWRWRIGLRLRTPTDELVLQMSNIAPWGEEVRAVRMIAKRRNECE